MKTKHIILTAGALAIGYGIYGYYQYQQSQTNGTLLTPFQTNSYWIAGIAGTVAILSVLHYPGYMKHIESKVNG